jgi:hypothetical protein
MADDDIPAPADDSDDALTAVRQLKVQIAHLHKKIDELLADSRRARPLLDKYERFTPPWAKKAGARR